MRKAALLAGFTLILLGVKTVSAQTNINNDYVVISDVGVSNLSDYTNALDGANWETYRLREVRLQLSFTNGFTIELKSALELLNTGHPLNLTNYRIENPSGYINPTLELMPGNIIGIAAQQTPVITKHH